MLSGIYFATLALMWLAFGNWAAEVLKASAQTDAARTAAANGAQTFTNFGRAFIYPNALGFLVSALWLPSKRTFAPLARYAVPSVLAGALTIPLSAFVFYFVAWGLYYLWPSSRFLVLLLSAFGALVPGFVTGQLLRFPRRDFHEDPTQHAPAV
jgi:hypothetical protein